MGILQQIICLFFGHFIAAHSFRHYGDPMYLPNFGGLFDNNEIFPPERNFDYVPFDTIFSSWRPWTPDLRMLAEFPSFLNIPRVQVSCDDSKLTVLVDKKIFGVTLTSQEVQLGNGCYSNGELPDKFVFAYGFEECGTKPVLHDGLQMFTNSIHWNLKAPPTWQAPPTVYISCIPKRLHKESNFISTPPVTAKHFNIQAMSPSWMEAAQSNIYTRGQEINLQVSANTGPDQQLFIQSCFTSASPEAQTRPRHAVILNKGCSSLAAPQTAQFAASSGAHVVNFILTTSNLIPELYVHCSVVVSDKGVTSATKSCNYNINQSRWEELSGDVDVCSCCSSKCKGPSVKSLPDDAKAVVSIGPFIILDIENDVPPDAESPTPTASQSSGLPSDGDVTVSGSSASKNDLSSQGVVVVSQDPSARLTLWLPGQVQGKDGNKISSQSEGVLGPSNDADSEPLPINEDAVVAPPTNEVVGQILKDFNDGSSLWDMTLPVVDGWPIPETMRNALFTEQRKRAGRSGPLDTGAVQADVSEPTEISINLMMVDQPRSDVDSVAESEEPMPPETEPNDLNPTVSHTVADESSQMQMDPMTSETNVEPIIRSKLEYSKSADGSQTISYEEEVKRQEGKCAQERSKRDALTEKREPGLRGLHSTFLYMLRRMDKAE